MGKKKVFVSGCFDMLHSGHIAFLNEASKHGDVYVGLGADETVYGLKGRYPVNNQNERKYILESLKSVKEVWINSGSGLMDFTQEIMKLNPDIFIVNEDGNTALILACDNKMTEVALELIKTGHANPEQINNNYGNTALILACENIMTEVTLELIKTGHVNPEQINNNYGNTALILACRNEMKEVALELIKTGHVKPDHIAQDGTTALSWACEKDMKDVAYELFSIGTFTINDLLFLKPEWIPEELFIIHPVDVTEVDI